MSLYNLFSFFENPWRTLFGLFDSLAVMEPHVREGVKKI